MWRLEEGAFSGWTLSHDFPVFPVILRDAGYFVGWTGKGWGPGKLELGGWELKNPLVRSFNYMRGEVPRPGRFRNIDYAANFGEFLRLRPEGRPFFFWCGTVQPHRPYPKKGASTGKEPSQVELPSNLPDHPAVRADLLDYALQIEYTDSHLARILEQLEAAGELETTLVVVTSGNGISFPRAQGTLYDLGTRVPLAAAWPARVPGGRSVADFVGLEDLAATFLDAAGVEIPAVMTGRSIVPLLVQESSGRLDPERDAVVTGVEGDYAIRALRTREWLYVRNLSHEDDPPAEPKLPYTLPDDAAVRDYLSSAFSRRPREELYDLRSDPWQLHDLSGDPGRGEILAELALRLDDHLAETRDPRARGRGFMVRKPPAEKEAWKPSSFGNLKRPGVADATLSQESLVAVTDSAVDTLARLVRRKHGNERQEMTVAALFEGLVQALSQEGDPQRSRELLASFRRRFQDSGRPRLAARALTDLGRLLLDEDPEAAERALSEGTAELERTPGVRSSEDLARTRALLALLALRSGAPLEFISHFDRALAALYEGKASGARGEVEAHLFEALALLDEREDLFSGEIVEWLFRTAETRSRDDRPHRISPERLLSIALVAADRDSAAAGLAAAARVASWLVPNAPPLVGQRLRLIAARWAIERGHLEEGLAWASIEPGEGSPAALHLAARARTLAARAHAGLGSAERFAESAAEATEAWAAVGTAAERLRELQRLAALGFEAAAIELSEMASPVAGPVEPAHKMKEHRSAAILRDRRGDEMLEVRLFEGNLRTRDYRFATRALFEIEWQPRTIELPPYVLQVVGGTVVRMTRATPGEPEVELWNTPRPLPENGALLVHEDGATSYVPD